MRIKKIRGKNMAEALRKVKEELGDNAVIIDSGKVIDSGQEFYEIVAALEDANLEEPLYSSNPLSLDKEDISFREIKKDLLEIKQFLRDIFNYQKPPGLSLELIKGGVPEEIALEIENSSLEISHYISEKIHKKGVSPLSKLQVFIGEPGVGKTTALFKIAFWYRVYREAKVVVLGMDNYKIGGKEQALKLSQILEIPYLQCDWEDFKKYYSQIKSNYEWILVDTPSLGKNFSLIDLEEVYNMSTFLRFYWVIRATDNYFNILKLWEELKEFPIEGIVLTFMDKIIKGTSLFWLLKEEIPFPVFASMGERIPEDIKKLDERALKEILIRGLEEK